MAPLDVLTKSAYVPNLLLDMLDFKQTNSFTRMTLQIFNKCFGRGKDTGKVNYS